MRYVLNVANYPTKELHHDKLCADRGQFDDYVRTIEPGWTSLAVSILPAIQEATCSTSSASRTTVT